MPSHSFHPHNAANYYMDELEASAVEEKDGVMVEAGGPSLSSTAWSDGGFALDTERNRADGDSDNDSDGFLHSVQQRKLRRAYSRRRAIVRCAVIVGGAGVVLVAALAAAAAASRSKSNGAQGSSSSSAPVYLKPPSDKLGTFCSGKYIESDGYQKCQQLCEPAACCYIPADVEGSCQDADHSVDCQVYQVQCSVLAQPHTASSNSNSQKLPDDDGVTDDPDYADRHVQPAPDDLADLCAVANLETLDGMRACAKECIQAHCCYDDEIQACGTIEQPNCAGYQPCFNLKHKLAGGGR